MTENKRKRLYWGFKIASVLVAVGLPLYAICDHFPVWVEYNTPGRTSITASILIGFTVLVVFRRAVFKFLKEKFNLKYAPPITIWAAPIIATYILEYISQVLADMNVVFWYGFIGAAVGMLLTFISEKFKEKE